MLWGKRYHGIGRSKIFGRWSHRIWIRIQKSNTNAKFWIDGAFITCSYNWIYKGGNVIYLREGDKVINNKNCYECYNEQGICTPIYNGNIGIIKEIKEIEYEDGSVYNKIIVDFGRIGTVILDSEQYKELDLGYAITVHKVQGSQFERIIFALDFTSYVLLSRELVYTAITRAQKHCTLVAQNSALRYAISHEKISEKTSHLVQLLYETAHPKLIF